MQFGQNGGVDEGRAEADADRLIKAGPLLRTARQLAYRLHNLGMAFERAPALEGLFVSTAAAIARSPNHKGPSASMSVPVSAFLCAILWTAVLLWLAAPIGGANAIVALIGGVLAGGIWYEERAAK